MVLDMNGEVESIIINEISEYTGIDKQHFYIKSVDGSRRALGLTFFILREVTGMSLYEIGRVFRKRTITFKFDQVYELIMEAYYEITDSSLTNKFFNETMELVPGKSIYLPIPLHDITFRLIEGQDSLNELIEDHMNDHSIEQIQKIIKLDLNTTIDRETLKIRIKHILE